MSVINLAFGEHYNDKQIYFRFQVLNLTPPAHCSTIANRNSWLPLEMASNKTTLGMYL